MTNIVYASNPLWKVTKVARRWHLRWDGSPTSDPQPLLAGLDIQLNKTAVSGRLTVDKCVEAVVALGLTVHYGVPGAVEFKNQARAALTAAKTAKAAACPT